MIKRQNSLFLYFKSSILQCQKIFLSLVMIIFGSVHIYCIDPAHDPDGFRDRFARAAPKTQARLLDRQPGVLCANTPALLPNPTIPKRQARSKSPPLSRAISAVICPPATNSRLIPGSVIASREQLLKRRLAYSTVSQVSYVLFGLALMNPAAMLGALFHVVFHSVAKNCIDKMHQPVRKNSKVDRRHRENCHRKQHILNW